MEKLPTFHVSLGQVNYYSCGNNAVVVIYLSILFSTLFCIRCVFNEMWYAFKSMKSTLPLPSIRLPDLSVKHSCQEEDENCHKMTGTFEVVHRGLRECLLRR
jgi:hypothetical protein